MFGYDFPNSSSHTAQIKFAIGRGHPFLAWTGSTQTPEHEVIEDISRNSAAIAYINKLQERNKIKVDECGLCRVPAYLVLLEDSTVVMEHPIELIINPVTPSEVTTPSAMFDKLFSMYSNAIGQITAASATALKDTAIKAQEAFTSNAIESAKVLQKAHESLASTAAESAKILQASAAEASKILSAASGTMEKQLGLIKDAYTHESTRADLASDAVIRMLNSDKTDGKAMDDLLKLVGAAPAILAMVEKLQKGAK